MLNRLCGLLCYSYFPQVLDDAPYGDPLPDEPVWISDVKCNGDESDLDECSSVVIAGDGDTCEGGVSVICEGVCCETGDNSF